LIGREAAIKVATELWLGSDVGTRFTAIARLVFAMLWFAFLAQPVAAADIVVSNNNDVVNGDTSSPSALIASPGPDGISLREALTAANNAAGPHTISFNAALACGFSTPPWRSRRMARNLPSS